jgi:hypothetical protein
MSKCFTAGVPNLGNISAYGDTRGWKRERQVLHNWMKIAVFAKNYKSFESFHKHLKYGF